MPTISCDGYQGGWQHTRLHESRDGYVPRALPDLCEPHTDRDSAALRSRRNEIFLEMTPRLLPTPSCAQPSIKPSYRAHIPSPGLSMGMKLPAGQTPPWGHGCRQDEHPAPSEGSPSATCSVSPRVSSASEPSRSGQTCTSPLSPLVLRAVLWLHSTHATRTGFVGKLWFRERPAQAGQVGTEQARPRRCMECPGRPASQSTTGLNPADRDEVPSQSDAQRAPWSDVRNGGRLVRSGCGLRVAVP